MGVDKALEFKNYEMGKTTLKPWGGRIGNDVWLCLLRHTGTNATYDALAHGSAKAGRGRKTGPWALHADGKSQVTEYDGDKPVRVHTVMVSTQHSDDVDCAAIERIW